MARPDDHVGMTGVARANRHARSDAPRGTSSLRKNCVALFFTVDLGFALGAWPGTGATLGTMKCSLCNSTSSLVNNLTKEQSFCDWSFSAGGFGPGPVPGRFLSQPDLAPRPSPRTGRHWTS